MGTSRYQVFLDLKPKGQIALPKAKSLLLEAALRPEPEHGEIAAARMNGAQSIAKLIEVCRDPWKLP
jgi:hypothetical protein